MTDMGCRKCGGTGWIEHTSPTGQGENISTACPCDRRTTTPPTDDEREGLAMAIAPLVYATVTGNDDCREWEEMPEYVQDIYFQAADAALTALTPHIAAEIAAAVAKERAAIVAWLRSMAAKPDERPYGANDPINLAAILIERGEYRSKP